MVVRVKREGELFVQGPGMGQSTPVPLTQATQGPQDPQETQETQETQGFPGTEETPGTQETMGVPEAERFQAIYPDGEVTTGTYTSGPGSTAVSSGSTSSGESTTASTQVSKDGELVSQETQGTPETERFQATFPEAGAVSEGTTTPDEGTTTPDASQGTPAPEGTKTTVAGPDGEVTTGTYTSGPGSTAMSSGSISSGLCL
eukprot:gene24466-10070_t